MSYTNFSTIFSLAKEVVNVIANKKLLFKDKIWARNTEEFRALPYIIDDEINNIPIINFYDKINIFNISSRDLTTLKIMVGILLKNFDFIERILQIDSVTFEIVSIKALDFAVDKKLSNEFEMTRRTAYLSYNMVDKNNALIQHPELVNNILTSIKTSSNSYYERFVENYGFVLKGKYINNIVLRKDEHEYNIVDEPPLKQTCYCCHSPIFHEFVNAGEYSYCLFCYRIKMPDSASYVIKRAPAQQLDIPEAFKYEKSGQYYISDKFVLVSQKDFKKDKYKVIGDINEELDNRKMIIIKKINLVYL